MPNPNQRCPCRSGERYKNCCLKRKKRRARLFKSLDKWGLFFIVFSAALAGGIAILMSIYGWWEYGSLCVPVKNLSSPDCGFYSYVKIPLLSFATYYFGKITWYVARD